MKKLLAIIFTYMLLFIPKALAETPAECFSRCINTGTSPTQCSQPCNFNTGGPTGNSTWQSILGTVEAPQNVNAYSENVTGLINLLSNILRLSVLAAGVWGLLNLISSGIQWIGASGNPEMIKQASSRIWMSLLGLIIIAVAFVVTGIIGLIFFGSADAIIKPAIYGPGPQ